MRGKKHLLFVCIITAQITGTVHLQGLNLKTIPRKNNLLSISITNAYLEQISRIDSHSLLTNRLDLKYSRFLIGGLYLDFSVPGILDYSSRSAYRESVRVGNPSFGLQYVSGKDNRAFAMSIGFAFDLFYSSVSYDDAFRLAAIYNMLSNSGEDTAVCLNFGWENLFSDGWLMKYEAGFSYLSSYYSRWDTRDSKLSAHGSLAVGRIADNISLTGEFSVLLSPGWGSIYTFVTGEIELTRTGVRPAFYILINLAGSISKESPFAIGFRLDWHFD